MKLQSVVYPLVSTALTAVSVHAIPNKSGLLPRAPSLDAPLSPGWRVAGPCMVKNSATWLTGVTIFLNGISYGTTFNTPEECTGYCDILHNDNAQNVYAAVGGFPGGYGCTCGPIDKYNQVLATRAYDDECNTPCPRNPDLACGREDRMQIYTRTPPPTPRLWRVASACSVDNASRVIEGARVFGLPNNSPSACTALCGSTTYSENGVNKWYSWAGVENGNECHCGKGWKNGVEPPSAPTYDCATPCTGDPTDPNGCGGSWRIQVFTSEQ